MSIFMKKVKEELKQLATDIKKMKSQRKGAPYGLVSGLWYAQREFRHKHIVYCEIRGRTRDQIEKPGESNLPNEYYIEKIKKEWLEELNREQALRVAA